MSCDLTTENIDLTNKIHENFLSAHEEITLWLQECKDPVVLIGAWPPRHMQMY